MARKKNIIILKKNTNALIKKVIIITLSLYSYIFSVSKTLFAFISALLPLI